MHKSHVGQNGLLGGCIPGHACMPVCLVITTFSPYWDHTNISAIHSNGKLSAGNAKRGQGAPVGKVHHPTRHLCRVLMRGPE